MKKSLIFILFLSSCAAPVATTKDQDPFSIELHKYSDNECTIRAPGQNNRDTDINCMSGTVHVAPDQQHDNNWLQWGVGLLALLRVIGA